MQWEKKQKLLRNSLLSRLNTIPHRLIDGLERKLNNKLLQVSQHITNGDNCNVILQNRSGKTKWRFPYTGVKSLLNNPFFERMKPINIAEILRFVERETGFMKHFEHVRQVQTGLDNYLNDLLAVFVNIVVAQFMHITD